MKFKYRIRLLWLALCLMLCCSIPVCAMAAETADGAFVLVAEAGGELLIPPEYVTYTENQTILSALAASGHQFEGLENGVVMAIDGVTGNFTRSDQNGSYNLSVPASQVTHYRFSENVTDSRPSEGLQELMTAMADYLLEEPDVQAAAQAAYQSACSQFVGISSASARTLAVKLKTAMDDYKASLEGEAFAVTFTDGNDPYTDVSISVENQWGKRWEDDGNGSMQLPAGTYTFQISKDGLHVQGSIQVSGEMTVKAPLPTAQWLKTFRLSGSYGAPTSSGIKFTHDEFELGDWQSRNISVGVSDLFTGTVYTYAEYDSTVLSSVPVMTAIYRTADTREDVEQKIPLASYTSGAPQVLRTGAVGTSVIYRVSSKGSDGFTYSQDYTVVFRRIPTLSGITLTDQEGTDLAPTEAFDPAKNGYTYKVLEEVTSVTVSPTPRAAGYTVTVNGEDASEAVTVPVSGNTEITVTVSYGAFTNTYTLTVLPGEGQKITFITASADVFLQVTNSNGMVMPYKRYQGTDKANRYQYTLVTGDTYNYIATKNTFYHVTDDFSLEDLANNTVQVDVPAEDWLSELALSVKAQSGTKGSLSMDTAFTPADHSYRVTMNDTDHLLYLWLDTEKEVKIHAIYDQIFGSSLYHGKPLVLTVTAGQSSGTQMKRFLLDEHPMGNSLTLRLTQEADGLTYYQDYEIDVSRKLTLSGITAKCDGSTAVLAQPDGTVGFAESIKRYDITVPMAARELTLTVNHHTATCYGEDQNSYTVTVDGTDVTETGAAVIALDGTIQTQTAEVVVRSPHASGGTSKYTLSILKSPPVQTTFVLNPSQAQLTLREELSGERLWPDEAGAYRLCEGFRYGYMLTRYGYIGKTGVLEVTRDSADALAVVDGDTAYVVEEDENGGVLTVNWTLKKAAANPDLDKTVQSQWPSFRGNDDNNGVTSAKIPYSAEEGTLYWANKIGDGIDSGAVGSPILVDDVLITYAGDTIFRVDTVTGEVLETGTMDHKSSFAITPPAYAEGMVFVALSNGTVQAFNARTLESLWIYTDPLGGQPNCPLAIRDGYLYTGFWNSETGDANFVCLSITDELPEDPMEEKCASWYQTAKGGYYWAGAWVGSDYLMVGTDDGTNSNTADSSRLLLLDCRTGRILDTWENLHGDIRSTVVYDDATNAWYFTSKGGVFYSTQVAETDGSWKFTNGWSLTLSNGSGETAMSTCSPVVYKGRAYVGVCGVGQFNDYSGHNISVIDLASGKVAYQVATQGYPQTSGLLTEAYGNTVYVYFFDNATPGKLRVLRDKPGQTAADYVTKESGVNTAYALFTPTGDHAQYAICSPIADANGTIYFKNDSAYLMAFGSAVEELTVTALPKKTSYGAGETFDPTGMIVTARYANGTTRDVTDYVTFSREPLGESDSTFAVSFPHVLYHNVENGTAMKAGIVTTTPVTTLKLTIGQKALTGDANGDGAVDLQDSQWILTYEAQLTGGQSAPAAADVNGDNVVNSDDAVLIARFAEGTIARFLVE